MTINNPNNLLALFFTRNTSLQTWHQNGSIERETEIYQALSRHGVPVRFVTYGNHRDLALRNEINDINLFCNRWGLPRKLYEELLMRVVPFFWHRNTIFKSNQVKGAELALRAAKRFGNKFIARCGYLHSDFIRRQFGADSLRFRKAKKLEREVFTGADRVVVTTPVMRKYIFQNYQIPAEKVYVIPNYVDTNIFNPMPDIPKVKNRICFIGRFTEQKNILTFAQSLRGLNIEITFIGTGKLKAELEEYINSAGIQANFLGNIPNNKLPELLNGSALLILPSLYEGHPKVLIEAMACGLPVIGTDVSGIREIISHKKNGFLCGITSEEIRDAIQVVMGDAQMQIRMGNNARDFALQNFSLEKIVKLELALMNSLQE